MPPVCSDRKTCHKAGLPFPVSEKKKKWPFMVKSIQATEQIFSFLLDIFFFQACLFCPLLTTHVPLVQLINNVFYCYRQPVLPNTIAGKAWRDCRLQVLEYCGHPNQMLRRWSTCFPSFPHWRIQHYAGYRNNLKLIALLQFSLDRVTEMYPLQLLQALLWVLTHMCWILFFFQTNRRQSEIGL